MNSYELDQPLDLRLKALNLSRGLNHEAPYQVAHNMHASPHGLALVNNFMLNGYDPTTTTSSSSCGNSLLSNHYASRLGPSHSPANSTPTGTNSSNTVSSNINTNTNASDTQTFVQNSTGLQAQSMQSSPPPPHQRSQQQQQQPCPMERIQAARPDNIHCQPLNHHQPHPLSRLHLTPQISSGHAHHLVSSAVSLAHPQTGSISKGSAGSCDLITSISPVCHQHQHQHHLEQHRLDAAAPMGSATLQNLAHQNSALKQRQYSPPLQPLHQHQEQHHFSQPHYLHHHHHQAHVLQPAALPVRSLSMSGQLLTASHLSLMVSSTSQPPTGAGGSGAPLANSASPSNVQSHQRMDSSSSRPLNGVENSGVTLKATNRNSASPSDQKPTVVVTDASQTQQSSPILMPSARKSSDNSLTPPMGSPNSANGDYQQTAGGAGSSSPPIVRQHSLVSRYSCKPCGIAFSQPETLRAHQEGYCTKTNRNQLRSQSAVSPSAIQQNATTGGNSNSQ